MTWTLAALLIFAAPIPLPAQDPVRVAQAEPGLEDLLEILQEETEVASKTRMNADFVPGIVTVLHGADLEALGVETVWEALSLVPGLQATRDRDGLPSVAVRGIDFPFNSGNLKVLVNGVPLSRDNGGVNGIVLLTPVQQVDRIEVIRGPGSVVHGDFAFMGLVNVVTRAQGTRAWLRGGGQDAISAGGTVSGTTGGFELSFGAAGWRSHDPALADPLVGHEDRGFATLLARRGGFALLGEAIARDLDPVGTTNTVNGAQEHWAVDARYGRALGPVHLDGHATLRNNDFRTPGNSFEGDVRELGLDASGRAGAHEWLAGAAFQQSAIDTALFRRPAAANRPPTVVEVRDQRREVWSLLAQDRFDATKEVSVTAGVRFDDDSNVGSRLTPRAAFVWRISERHILKAQHAEGFRPPTFFELYGATGTAATDIDFEVNATTELNYVHRRPRSLFRGTAFRTRLRDMIFVSGPQRFSNSAEARAYGLELEWEQQLGSRVRMLANVSLVDEEENRNLARTTFTSPVTAPVVGNVAVLFRPTPRALLTARLNHVGDRSDNEATAGWDVLDVSALVQDVVARGIGLRLGVKNVLDDEVRYVVALPNGVQRNTFPGRTAWVQVSWER
jgi:outer membrane receptor for ferrienterochelin and colicins